MIRTILTTAACVACAGIPTFAAEEKPYTATETAATVLVDKTAVIEDHLPIEINRSTNQFITTAKINGIEGRYIIDTGATHTTLASEYVAEKMPQAELVPVQIQGSTNVKNGQKIMFGSIDLGPMHFQHFPLFVTSLKPVNTMMEKPIAGILGTTTFLQNPLPFIFSAKNAKVCWSKKYPAFPCTMRGSFDDNMRFISMAKAGGKDIPLLLDTGSSITIVPHGTWEPDAEQATHMKSADINSSSTDKMQRGKPMDLDLGGGLVLKNIRPWIAAPGAPGQIGMDILQHFDFCIARKNGNFTITARMHEPENRQ
ncbi:aspartyl protease family protein [Akkermansia glycaniphila]|uniref:aspartyl protease family protein n=1 Tax=Akkermansia glycaniphila TaxID=1679444 RepID=UPI001C0391CE|nr:aspartyl protease family protein [Akkermansia glycaniphila]MBT9448869.1 aspartyl protease family protein [Akkermansia glycaniphila]